MQTLKGVNSQLSSFEPRDYDGDGTPDMVLRDNHEGGDFLVYGKQGLLAQVPPVKVGPDFFLADLKGEGRARLFQNRAGTFDYYSSANPKTVAFVKPRGVRMGTADLDGDGREELLLLSGVFSPGTNSFHRFDYPPKLKGESWFNRHVVAGTFIDGKTKCVAVTACQEKYGSSAVCIFAPDGDCLYYEEFGEPLHTVLALRDDAGDHLVVQLSDRLLICP
jgi:hypothetical protein